MFVDELDNLLHVGAKDALRRPAREGRVEREPLGRRYLYCSIDANRKRRQLLLRQSQSMLGRLHAPLPAAEVLADEPKATIILFFSLLDEQQRRPYAGLESLKMGHGGDTRIARLPGLDVGTVERGRTALLQRDVRIDRVRQAGGGRKAVEKKRRKSLRASND
jgi:hypothetical protein